MPSEEQLEYEITLARNDLEANLQELQLVVREKLDVRKHARELFEQAKQKVREFAVRREVIATAAVIVTFLSGLWTYRRHVRHP